LKSQPNNNRPKRWFFSTFDLLLVALMAALGIATKPIIVPLTHILTGPLLIPGGAVAGGIYMMWMVLGGCLVKKKGAATMTGLVQGFIVLVTGVYGTHGAASLVTYTLPGLAIDFVWLIMRSSGEKSLACFFAGIAANLTGTFLSNLLFFKLPAIPLVISLTSAALSGGLGGLIAYGIMKRINSIRYSEGKTP